MQHLILSNVSTTCVADRLIRVRFWPKYVADIVIQVNFWAKQIIVPCFVPAKCLSDGVIVVHFCTNHV